ncbi:MAG: putative polyketide biosynthesis zinc-dependent hydrolase PksB [Candidatus Heimdallarchaeota archaeon LC_2]|nr:MAG: putative polyketide biosynthesis zinc-dependent hydrolase PksB [Candidatus Heimdallarchaeota archaeon LC_2]
MENWFEIIQIKDYIYIIRERLDLIDDRFHTKFINNYLILGSHSAILFDTGSGHSSIKSIVSPIISDRDLIIINSHNHFDHIGGNHEFQSVYIHQLDLKKITKPIDVSFLESSSSEFAAEFSKKDYLIHSSDEHLLLIGDEVFSLGDLEVKVISTPGHTAGSICLLTSNDELFTGDTIHYGSIYLSDDDNYKTYKHSLQRLNSLVKEKGITTLFPAHEEYEVNCGIIDELLVIIESVDNHLINAKYDFFLESNYFDTPKFRIIYPVNYDFS